MRQRHEDLSDFMDDSTFGADPAAARNSDTTAAVSTTWLGTLSAFLTGTNMRWDDGGSPVGPRAGDVRIKDVAKRAVQENRWTRAEGGRVVEGAETADIRWVSQLATPSGTAWLPWAALQRWSSWTTPLLQELHFRRETTPRLLCKLLNQVY